jgi:hypothetical protein
MAERKEPFGATTAAIVSGLFVLFIDKLLPLQEFFGEFPILPRVLLAATASLFVWKAWSYWEILCGADEPRDSRDRADFDALLCELQSGGTPAKVYREWLTKALDRVDAFFGDAGRNDKSWFARALGLETHGARWTAPAFDRCLLLALVYPIFTIYLIWVWSGRVGVAERALFLPSSQPDDVFASLSRLALGVALLAATYAIWRWFKAEGLLRNILWAGAALALALAIVRIAGAVGARADAVVVAFAVLCAGAGAFAHPVSGAFAFAGASAGTMAFGFALTLAGTLVFMGGGGAITAAHVTVPFFAITAAFATVPFFAVAAASAWSVQKGILGWFLSALFLVITFAVFATAWFAAPLPSWPRAGAVIFVFGLLTLVNAPFDWFAIGLTRALLRRGLAPGGRGPFFYAAVDLVVAPPVIGLLAFVTVFAVQAFDDVAVLRAGPGARILSLDDLFKGLETRPADPEFWWIWMMLFSTLIPSALNLCVAAASLVRGLPFLNDWIVRRMTATGTRRDSDRLLLASALSAQIAGGFLAMSLALYFLGAWLLPIWLPFLGGYVEHFSEALAAYDAPRRIFYWYGSEP